MFAARQTPMAALWSAGSPSRTVKYTSSLCLRALGARPRQDPSLNKQRAHLGRHPVNTPEVLARFAAEGRMSSTRGDRGIERMVAAPEANGHPTLSGDVGRAAARGRRSCCRLG